MSPESMTCMRAQVVFFFTARPRPGPSRSIHFTLVNIEHGTSACARVYILQRTRVFILIFSHSFAELIQFVDFRVSLLTIIGFWSISLVNRGGGAGSLNGFPFSFFFFASLIASPRDTAAVRPHN